MVQGKAKDFTLEAPAATVSHHVSGEKATEINDEAHPSSKDEEKTTLTIVQEFPKK